MAIVLGLMVGLVLGLTGAGGSMLAVPLLSWGLGWTLPQAAPVALLAVCASAALGAVTAGQLAHVRYRAALLMAGAGLVAAPLGGWVAGRLSLDALAALFAVALMLGAARMWLHAGAARRAGASARWCRLDPATGRIVWTPACAAAIAGVGSAAGFVAGLLGVGGGLIIVPSLRSCTELSMQSAVATSLMAVALISGASVGLSIAQGYSIHWLLALPFVAGCIAGTAVARVLAPRIAGQRLQQGFAALMALGAGSMALGTMHVP